MILNRFNFVNTLVSWIIGKLQHQMAVGWGHFSAFLAFCKGERRERKGNEKPSLRHMGSIFVSIYYLLGTCTEAIRFNQGKVESLRVVGFIIETTSTVKDLPKRHHPGDHASNIHPQTSLHEMYKLWIVGPIVDQIDPFSPTPRIAPISNDTILTFKAH